MEDCEYEWLATHGKERLIPAGTSLFHEGETADTMIIMLRGGTIDLYEGDKITDRLFVDGGFAEVTPERCTVLANKAIPLAEVNKVDAQRRLAEAEAAYEAADKSDPAVEDEALDAVQSARAMVEAAG